MSKKIYSKPEILFEDFSLSTNIAAGCEKVPFSNVENCGVKWGKLVLFGEEGYSNCSNKIIEGKNSYDNLCYHNPNEGFNVFNS